MADLTWLLATRNQGKIRELRRILEGTPVRIISLDSLGIEADCPETGTSFLENAKQKAAFYFQRAQVPVLADDSGLETDALDGAPGVFSARFGGFKTQQEKNTYLLELTDKVPDPYRTARFRCAAVYFDGKTWLSGEGTLEGVLGRFPIGDRGFGYDPIFYLRPEGPSLAQIHMGEKNRISHRGQAFKELLTAVFEYLGLRGSEG